MCIRDSPYVDLFGLRVGTYGLWMLAGLFAAFFLFARLFRSHEICWECALVVVCCAFGLALLGGYIFYMLFSVGLPLSLIHIWGIITVIRITKEI